MSDIPAGLPPPVSIEFGTLEWEEEVERYGPRSAAHTQSLSIVEWAKLVGGRVTRKQAVADAEGLLRAEGLKMSLEHQALAARWVAGEIDSAQLEQLGLDLVR